MMATTLLSSQYYYYLFFLWLFSYFSLLINSRNKSWLLLTHGLMVENPSYPYITYSIIPLLTHCLDETSPTPLYPFFWTLAEKSFSSKLHERLRLKLSKTESSVMRELKRFGRWYSKMGFRVYLNLASMQRNQLLEYLCTACLCTTVSLLFFFFFHNLL